MAVPAAFFDLDRTLLTTSSASAYNQAMFETGLTSHGTFPGQRLMTRFYELAGETLPSMALARAAVLALRGRTVEEVQAAAELGGQLVERQIAPFARHVLASHRDAGRRLVLATTTPVDLVGPLARRLGFDDVVATRYATATGADGVARYTGRLDGPFCWSWGKLGAVRRYARDRGIDLGRSYAYSDSVYDLPLLSAVGRATAVNPDLRLLPVALARRWPVVHLDAPAGVPKVLGVEPLDLLRLVAGRHAFPYARFDIAGVENVPRRGGLLVVANHRSHFDPVALALALFDAGRRPRFLGRRALLDGPVIGPLARAFGSIVVDRDGPDGGGFALDAAAQALEGGEAVVVLPQGGIPEGEAFFDPRLRARPETARLAAATGAPVLPVAVWGSEAVWPRSSRLPIVTQVLSPPTVTVRMGPTLTDLPATDPSGATDRLLAAISALLPDEARIRRIPTPREVRRAMPPGA